MSGKREARSRALPICDLATGVNAYAIHCDGKHRRKIMNRILDMLSLGRITGRDI